MSRLDEIKARTEKATEGPWVTYGIAGITSEEWDIAWEGHGTCQECDAEVSQVPFVNPSDAEFCAHAREDIPWLIARVERLEKVAEAAKGHEHDRDMILYGEMCPICAALELEEE